MAGTVCLGGNELDEALTVGEALAFVLRTNGATEELEAGAPVQQEGGRCGREAMGSVSPADWWGWEMELQAL